MASSRPPGPHHDAPELLDGDGLAPAERRRALADLDRFYRLAGRPSLRRSLRPFLDRGPGRQRWLDVGAGSGAVAADLERWARRRGAVLTVVALDLRLDHLAARPSRHRATAADATRLPFADGTFDVVFSHLLFHHFDPAGNHTVLAEMTRVAAAAAVVVDLHRTAWLPGAARLLLPLLGLGRVAVHDGIVSARSSYRRREVAAIATPFPVLELRRRLPAGWSLTVAGRGRF
jgi:SAM-dependent methyltransferase